MKGLIFCWCLLSSASVWAQSSLFPEMGQMPSNAFPVCGIDTFRQLSIPFGSGGKIDIPGCGLLDVPNPYYYSFTCYTGGTMALLIAPVFAGQDYNWELFDITGHDPNDIFLNNYLAVVGNWSGTYGRTGAKKNGQPYTLCISPPESNDSTFSDLPILITGHQYLILVTENTTSQAGYQLAFAGGTAVIRDPAPPHLVSAYVDCSQKIINVMVNKQMRCYSLAADGSDFSINDNHAIITGATGKHCDEQFDLDTIQIRLRDALPDGNYSITIRNGTDGNTLMDNCGDMIPVGEVLPVTIASAGKVSADFDYDIRYGCNRDTIQLLYPLANPGDQWEWRVDSAVVGTTAELTLIRSDLRSFTISHKVSNAVCSDTASRIIPLDNEIKAAFTAPSTVCPKDVIHFVDASTGQISAWYWNFGDGTFSEQQNPGDHPFSTASAGNIYPVTLMVRNIRGCMDTARESITRLQSCSVSVPSAFTPNNDGKNDFLFPLNSFLVSQMEFMVYNRLGQRVFETHDAARKWDGTFQGAAQATGTYVWTLSYTDTSSGKKIFLRGFSVLIR